MIDLSMSELHALTRKALRGAGYEWGLAEDGARAAVWLAARGRPAAEVIAALLEGDIAPETCPIRAGCRLADARPAPPAEVGELVLPVLVVPFVSDFAGVVAEGDPMSIAPQQVTLAAATDTPPVTQSRACIAPDHLATLNRWAHRTYAPATEASRQRGAG